MSKPIIFLGSTQQILEIEETCDLLGLDVAGIIDDDYYGNTLDFEGIPYIGSEKTVDWQRLKKDHDFLVPVNPVPGFTRNIAKRKNFIKLVDEYGLPCANVIDPNSRVSRRAHLGQGIYVAYNAYIASNTVIGDHCQIHYTAGIMHDCILGRNTVMNRASALISSVTVGENTYFAPFSRVLKIGARIGNDSCIHPGVMVFRDVNPNETVTITSKKIYSMIVDTPNN